MPLPNVAGALWGMTDQRTYAIVMTTIVDYETKKEIIDEGAFMGVMTPIPPRHLAIKPEGQRNWKWYTFQTDKELKNNDVIEDLNSRKRYKILSVSDWSSAGYFEYEAAEQAR